MPGLILRAHSKTTCRRLIEVFDGHSRLRAVLGGMEDKLLHCTTLQWAGFMPATYHCCRLVTALSGRPF
jgi:hypothetical protein